MSTTASQFEWTPFGVVQLERRGCSAYEEVSWPTTNTDTKISSGLEVVQFDALKQTMDTYWNRVLDKLNKEPKTFNLPKTEPTKINNTAPVTVSSSPSTGNIISALKGWFSNKPSPSPPPPNLPSQIGGARRSKRSGRAARPKRTA